MALFTSPSSVCKHPKHPKTYTLTTSGRRGMFSSLFSSWHPFAFDFLPHPVALIALLLVGMLMRFAAWTMAATVVAVGAAIEHLLGVVALNVFVFALFRFSVVMFTGSAASEFQFHNLLLQFRDTVAESKRTSITIGYQSVQITHSRLTRSVFLRKLRDLGERGGEFLLFFRILREPHKVSILKWGSLYAYISGVYAHFTVPVWTFKHFTAVHPSRPFLSLPFY
jgi:hypothetical protein